ncbi:MAG: serpin family protein [Pseudomonadota bacterium]
MSGITHAQPAPTPVLAASSPALASSAPTTKTGDTKDITLDNGNVKPPTATTVTGGVLGPTPGASRPSTAGPSRRYSAAAHDVATAGALGELALDLMRQQSASTGNAQVNTVVSPLSLVSALGMVHAGTSGISAREIAVLLGTPTVGDRIYTTRLPVLLDSLAKPGAAGLPFVMANRVWLDDSVVSAIPVSYARVLTERFHADGAVLQFSQAPQARKTINSWVSQKTANRIPELMPEGAITPSTKFVVTNAIHFKSKWAEPFDPAKTAPLPFHLTPGGASRPVPTMVAERQIRMGTVDNIMVLEFPFAGNEFTLMVGIPPEGHTLNAFETDLEGLDIASWNASLKPSTCRVELPKFSIAPSSKPLKASLQAMGMKTAFTADADFAPLLGKAAKGVYLDNVFQSATIIIDEAGGEAAAATGAAAMSKSFSMPAPACAVNRPFIFAVMHKASGAPLFVGKVADPAQQ